MRRVTALLMTACVAVAACGCSDSAEPATTASSDAEVSTTEASDGAVAEDTATTDRPDEPSGDETARAFPVSIEHKFGSTTIEEEPERVVSVGYNEHDFLLALGVVPVGLRDWYGEQPNSVWPWAQDELGDATPEVIASDALNFEQIAAMNPDLIVGVWSGMTDADYELLSAIAPTVAQPGDYEDYGTPWQEQTMILGRATGRVAEAESVVADIDARFAAVREQYPEWEGMTASVAFVTETGPGAYASQDTRSRIMADLGFVIPDVNDTGDNGFYLELSAEDISALDVDVLVWVAGSHEGIDAIVEELITRTSLDVVTEGREVFAGLELTGAFSHGSPLSLEFALEQLVPEISAAVDGDPTTAVPSAVDAGAVDEQEPGDEQVSADAGAVVQDDAEAAAAAWTIVFDSTEGFEAKADYLEDAEGLRETIEAYTAAGDGFGGISLVPTSNTVDGGVAEVSYDVNFGENPAYSDQAGTLTLVDGVWTVSRDSFCAFMTSARVPCEA